MEGRWAVMFVSHKDTREGRNDFGIKVTDSYGIKSSIQYSVKSEQASQ